MLATISLTNGQLLIGGGTGNDIATVTSSGTTITASVTGVDSESFAAEDVDSILFVGLAGNDQFTNDTSIPSTAYGQAGNDTLIGGSGNDRLIGGPGIDTFDGRAGDDEVRGGIDGKKTIRGGAGNDRLFGGTGDNDIDAGDGDDLVHGGSGVDTVIGGDGNDMIYPGSGNDSIQAGPGNDSLNTGSGDDNVSGGSGNDLLFTGPGNDTVNGGDGDDNINGGDGDDELNGGAGNDRLTGANGDDTINGESGDDKINGGFGDDTADGGTGNRDLYFISSVERNYRVYGTLNIRDMFGEGGTDTTTRMSWIHFNDKSYAPESQVERVVTAQPIILSNSNGSNTADFFGDSDAEFEIKNFINDIYYQGNGKTQIDWLAETSWRNSNANNGVWDINQIVNGAPGSVTGDPDSVLNVFFVEQIRGASGGSENSANGLAYIDNSGVLLTIGSNLLTFDAGLLAVARVSAHEIGHNLSLDHVSSPSNLMYDQNLTDDNLTTSQRNAVRASRFAEMV